MATAVRVFVILFCFFSLANPSYSLYEDQVGLADWHQRYVGKVKQAVFHTQKTGRKRVVVSTEENVIASLDLRHGEIFWRRAFGENDAVDGIDIALGKYVVTLSSKGSVLRAWNLPDGHLVWESFLEVPKQPKSMLLIPRNLKVGKDYPVVVVGKESVLAVSGIDGESLWKTNFPAEEFEVQKVIQPAQSQELCLIGSAGPFRIQIYQINLKNGALLKQKSATLPSGFAGEVALVANDKAVTLDKTGSVVVVISFQDEEISFRETSISDLVKGYRRVKIFSSTLNGVFTLKVDELLLFLSVEKDGNLKVLEETDDEAAISETLSLSDGQQVFALAQHRDNEIQLKIKLDNDWSSDLLTERIIIDQERGSVQKVFINNYIRTDRTQGFRALIVMEDHSLLLLQQGEIVWRREDGLASVVDATMSELPVEKDSVSVAKVEQNLFEWLKGHILKAKGTLMLASPEDLAVIQEIRLKSSGKNKLTRDHNGFRKLIIVLTGAGKLFALHTGDGRIVWSSFLKSFHRSAACQHPTGVSLYQWQNPHHHAMDENPSVLVVGRCQKGSGAPGVLSIVDTYLGKELNYFDLVHSVKQVMALPLTDSREQRLHLLIDDQKRAHLYPKSSEAIGILRGEFENIYWYSVEAEDGIIRGHALKGNCVEENVDKYCFDMKELWSVVFPLESEKIVSTVTRKMNEVVHTQAKVIADQDVLYKYISRNLLFVATVAPKVGFVTPDESWLVIYLIDTITGRILHRMTHQGAQGPVHAVFSENWVVYHYFNLRAHRHEMSVTEIYDQSRAVNKNVWKLLLGKHNLTTPISSYSRPDVVTKSQSYFFTHSVKAISVTSTAKGITSKQLLVGTIGDQVLALDKRFLDPRRTLNPSQAEKEEGIIPLTDSLPIMSQSYVTHSRKVDGLRGMVTAPARLESSTHVFVYGVDLFYTRLAPSRTYDSLTDDFSYALLLVTIVALVAAIYATWILSGKKELRDKWR